jgi:predicted dehydrogenase
MKKKINVAIIGKNFGYKVIYKIIKKIKSFNLIAFCFRSKPSSDLNKKIVIYKDWKKLLKNKKINAIIITSPPETHFKIINEAIKRNIHIFCEKPVTRSLFQIAQICNLIKNKDIKHFVNFEFPKIKAFKFYKDKILKKIKINKVIINCSMKISQQKRSNWKNIHNKGGGIFYNYICHSLYYMENLFGKLKIEKFIKDSKKKPSNLRVEFNNINKNFKIILNFKLLATNSKKRPIHQIKIISNKGAFYLESKTESLKDEFILKKSKNILFKPKENIKDFRLKPTLVNLKNFERSIIKNRLSNPNFFDAKRVHYLINEINS